MLWHPAADCSALVDSLRQWRSRGGLPPCRPEPVGTLVNGMPVLVALSLAWELDRFFNGSDQAPPDQVVVAIGNQGLRQAWQQVLLKLFAPLGVVIHP